MAKNFKLHGGKKGRLTGNEARLGQLGGVALSSFLPISTGEGKELSPEIGMALPRRWRWAMTAADTHERPGSGPFGLGCESRLWPDFSIKTKLHLIFIRGKKKMEGDNKISVSKVRDYVVCLDFPTSLLLSTLASDVLNSGLFGKQFLLNVPRAMII